MKFVDFNNVNDMLLKTVKEHGTGKALTWFSENGDEKLSTWRDISNESACVAKSLITLGVSKGDKVAIISYTSYKWIIVDLGILSLGACTVGIHQNITDRETHYILDHSDSVLLFVEDYVQLEKILAMRHDLPRIRKIILMNGVYENDDLVMSFYDFLMYGETVSTEMLTMMMKNVKADDIASIVYTSGTTGYPKGVMLTHDNWTFTVQSAVRSLELRKKDKSFIYLPLAHVLPRLTLYCHIFGAIPCYVPRSKDTIYEEISDCKPDFFICVPALLEDIYSRFYLRLHAKDGLALRFFTWACMVGSEVSDHVQQKKKQPLGLMMKYAVAYRLLFKKVRDALGVRVRWCIAGAAPVNINVAKFFHAAGIVVLEGFGMTEDTSFSHVNRYDKYHFGCVGLPGPGIEHRIGDDGEIMIRGRNVMQGYYKMPKETAETLSSDGWLRTDDLGVIYSDNLLHITGRKKEIIRTSNGKKIIPLIIEGQLNESPYIYQSCIIGNGRSYIAALISLEKKALMEYARRYHLSYDSFDDIMENRVVYNLIGRVVDEVNARFSSHEAIKNFAIVPEFTILDHLLSQTLSLKREEIEKRYSDVIDEMYKPGDKVIPMVRTERFIERRKLPDRRISNKDLRGAGAVERRISSRRMA